MSDIVLKIYSTTTSWGDTLDHIIYGDIVDYEINRNGNTLLSNSRFRINDTDGRWGPEIGIDHWDGSSENTQIWRAFSRSDALLGSGVISRVVTRDGTLIIEGLGMTSLLKRSNVVEQFYQSLTAAGANVAGDYILKDSTYGLLPIYLGTTYGTIDYSTYVTSPTGSQPRVWKFDNTSLYDALVEIANGSYGSNSKSYEAYLGEAYTPPNTFSRYLYFKEKESTASAKTLTAADVDPRTFNVSDHSSQNYNSVQVTGEINPNGFLPSDDILQLSDTFGDWDYASTGSTGVISAVGGPLGTSVLLVRNDVAERFSFFHDSMVADGKVISRRATKICFKAYADHDEGGGDPAVRKNFFLRIGVRDKYGNVSSLDDTGTAGILRYGLSILSNNIDTGEDNTGWQDFEVPLPQPNNSNGWVNGPATFTGSGIQLREYYDIYQVGFYLDDDANEEIVTLSINGLIGVGATPFRGTYPTSNPTYLRQYLFNDQGLKSNVDCQNMAQNILTGLNIKQYAGTCELHGIKRDFTLQPGNTVEVVLPSRGVNIQAGQTPAKLPIQNISYRPNRQILTLGRVYSDNEVINQISRTVKLHAKPV